MRVARAQVRVVRMPVPDAKSGMAALNAPPGFTFRQAMLLPKRGIMLPDEAPSNGSGGLQQEMLVFFEAVLEQEMQG